MNKKIVAFSSLSVLLILPVFVLAQVNTPGQYSGTALQLAIDIITFLLDILWIVAATFVVVMLVIAGFKYLTAQGDPGKIQEANKAVIWGVAGVAVILLSWSITGVLRTQFSV